MKKEFANEIRTFTKEYMEMRCRENQNKEQSLDEYYRGLNDYIKEHQTTNSETQFTNSKTESRYDDYIKRFYKTRELTINRF